jgi:hypothetical protein
VSVDFKHPGEIAVSHACVPREDGIYRMWYCYAIGSSGYRIGYAESVNGIHYRRKDEEAGIDASPSGRDSEMVCYPHLFEHKGWKYMLYNGNGYGRTGFGYAILETER